MRELVFYDSYQFFVFGFYQPIRGSDTSTGESGSEVEDITSPKASGNYTNPRLTPVHEEVSDHDIGILMLQKERKDR